MIGVPGDIIVNDRLQIGPVRVIPLVLAANGGAGTQQEAAAGVFKPRLIFVAGPVGKLIAFQLRSGIAARIAPVQPNHQGIFHGVVFPLHRGKADVVVAAVFAVLKLPVQRGGAVGQGSSQ